MTIHDPSKLLRYHLLAAAGTLMVPAAMATPARYMAFKAEGVSIRNAQGVPRAWISRRIGGHQVDYADESPQVRQTFAEALAKVGLQPRMDEAYQTELADLPPPNLLRGA